MLLGAATGFLLPRIHFGFGHKQEVINGELMDVKDVDIAVAPAVSTTQQGFMATMVW